MRCPATAKVPNGGAPRFFGQLRGASVSKIIATPFFGQVQMVVMLSGPGYDFRQGIQRGVIQG